MHTLKYMSVQCCPGNSLYETNEGGINNRRSMVGTVDKVFDLIFEEERNFLNWRATIAVSGYQASTRLNTETADAYYTYKRNAQYMPQLPSLNSPKGFPRPLIPFVQWCVGGQSSDMPQEMVQEAVEIVTMSVDKFINVKNYEV